MKESAEKIVRELINSKREGAFWDFKREWYSKEKKADLLHDIICMANNLENRDAYIIIGIDEENDCKAVDITSDNNRRNTQYIVDLLSRMKFAGNVRPSVEVCQMDVDGNTVDVIVIENSFAVPFYLENSYDDIVKKYHIYTRIKCTNTPKDLTADIDNIELLWKKRFRMTSDFITRMEYYLRDRSNWIMITNRGYNDIYSNSEFPEFTIRTYDDVSRTGYEYYHFRHYDNTPEYGKIELCLNDTPYKTFVAVALNGRRYFSPAPNENIIKIIYNKPVYYKYFVKSSIAYTLNKFYYNQSNSEETTARNYFLKDVLVFESDDEIVKFEEYALSKWNKIDDEEIKSEIAKNIPSNFRANTDGELKMECKEVCENIQFLQILLKDFRNQN